MNFLDVLIIAVWIIGAVRGYVSGAINQVFGLVGFFIAVMLSLQFYSITAEFFSSMQWVSDKFLKIVSLIATFVIFYFALKLIAKIADKTLKVIGLGFLNRLSGVVLGVVLSSLILCPILYYLLPVLKVAFTDSVDKSVYLPYFVAFTDQLKQLVF